MLASKVFIIQPNRNKFVLFLFLTWEFIFITKVVTMTDYFSSIKDYRNNNFFEYLIFTVVAIYILYKLIIQFIYKEKIIVNEQNICIDKTLSAFTLKSKCYCFSEIKDLYFEKNIDSSTGIGFTGLTFAVKQNVIYFKYKLEKISIGKNMNTKNVTELYSEIKQIIKSRI